MTAFNEVLTPRIDGAAMRTYEQLEQQQQQLQDASEQRLQLERMRYRAQLDQRRMHSEMSSQPLDVDASRSLARVYEPSLRERVRAALEGRWGLYLEMTNFVLSVVIFAIYVAELYDDDLTYSTRRRTIELLVTTFFISDLALHLFVAPSAWRYLFSPTGIIDLLTIVPSIIVFLVPATRTQLFFVLRVLRIFRALRVLRLKQFLRFKKSKFDYELAVFILSSVAVILCAAGMFHALEESYYLHTNARLRFHEALYFVLVTIATIGYGDISPRTTMGQLFVVFLIIGIFTVVPHEVSKLNRLAKQTHAYDRDYVGKTTDASGHVIVAGSGLTTDTVLAFLHEFYHVSRGTIHLDVVVLSDTPPAPALMRMLATDKFRWRARYLRGSIATAADQRRVQLATATAVFLLASNQQRQQTQPATQDATTILQTLAVRNFADSTGSVVDIYTQLRSHDAQHELAAVYLGAYTTKTATLQSLLLARAAVCPGASTLILNLLQSVDAAEYAKERVNWRKLWLQEYVDGMCHQLFPMVFTDKFQFETYEDVVRNVYERYNAILVSVYDNKRQPRRSIGGGAGGNSTASGRTGMPLAPFQSYICEGDIGFVIAKSASVVLHIVNTYGAWRDGVADSNDRGDSGNNTTTDQQQPSSERTQTPSATTVRPVCVSSDTLLRRPVTTRQTSFRPAARVANASSKSDNVAESARIDTRESKWRENNDDSSATANDSSRVSTTSSTAALLNAGQALTSTATPPVRVPLQAIDEHSASPSSLHATNEAPPVRLHGSRVVEAARRRDVDQLLAALQRDHFRADLRHLTDHYVVCSGPLSEALALVHSLRAFYQFEYSVRLSRQSTAPATATRRSLQLSLQPSQRCFVLLVDALPSARAILRVLEESDTMSSDNDSDNILESVYFVAGSSARVKDLVRVGAPSARHVIVLPVEQQASSQSPATTAATDDVVEPTSDGAVSLADFGVISSMLAVEITRHQRESPRRRLSPVSPRRRRLTSRTLSMDFALASMSTDAATPSIAAATAVPSFQREVDQGLPLESVKLRMLERFPDLDASVFREPSDVIEARLHDQLDAKQSSLATELGAAAAAFVGDAAVQQPLQHHAAENTLGVLQHTINARFCRPRDHAVCHDRFPFLTPSFASGNVFVASLLDRIVCQSFYNPYITDLVEALAGGSAAGPAIVAPQATTSMRVPRSALFAGAARNGDVRHAINCGSSTSFETYEQQQQQHRRLFRMRVDDAFVGGKFLDVFLALLQRNMLAIAIFRSPNTAVLENLLPYVYTCPDPETVLHANDRVFVLG